MLQNDSRAAGQSNESRQFKDISLRTSKTFQDSDIFGVRSPVANSTKSPAVKPASDFFRRNSESMSVPQVRISRTHQDSNIFGTKDISSSTITETTKKEMQKPVLKFTAHKKVIPKPGEITTVFTSDDKTARQRLKRSDVEPFQPYFEKSSPTKRHMTEFYGEQYGDKYDGNQARPQTATMSRSFAVSPKSATEMKWQQHLSNIFSDNTKVDLIRQVSDVTQDRLMSAKSNWSSKDAFKKSNNLSKSQDLSNSQLTAFAQTKKKAEMNSDIFHSNPKREELSHVEAASTPKANTKASFADNKNQDIRRTQHMFSDLFSHDDKNYTYNNTDSRNKNIDPLRATNQVWSDSKTEKMSPGKTEEQSATDRKAAHLSGSAESVMKITEYKSPKGQKGPGLTGKALEKQMKPNMSHQEKKGHEMRSELPFGESSQSWAGKQVSNDSLSTYDFDLTSIPNNVTYETLKKAFAGYHVIDLKAERDPVNGSELGAGRVKLRASTNHDILKLKHDLKEKGIVLAAHEEDHKKKNKNYRDLAKVDWHDQYLQGEEGRLKSEFTTPLESKLRNLESEGDIFGSSTGVGKWDRSSLEKAKTEHEGEQKSKIDHVKTLNWKKTIKQVSNTGKSDAQSKPLRNSTKASTTQARKAK